MAGSGKQRHNGGEKRALHVINKRVHEDYCDGNHFGTKTYGVYPQSFISGWIGRNCCRPSPAFVKTTKLGCREPVNQVAGAPTTGVLANHIQVCRKTLAL